MARRIRFSLLRTLFGGVSSNRTKQARRPNLALERLEDRAVLASFVYDSGSTSLFIQLDESGESITLTAQGGGNYVFTSNANFYGGEETGLTGENTKTLTIANTLSLTNVDINNAVTETSVVFGNSLGSYVDNFSINLDQGARDITFTGNTIFDDATYNNLVAKTTRAVTQTAGTLVVGGSSTFQASTTITLAQGGNDFKGVVSLTGGTVQITDTNDLTLGILAVTGNLTATSTGALELGQGIVGGNLTVNSNGGSITQAGSVSINQRIVKQGAGKLILSLANSHSQGTSVEGGEMVVKNVSALGTGGLEIAAGAKVSLDVGSAGIKIDSIKVDGLLDIDRASLTVASGLTQSGLVGMLAAARGDGSWNGPQGITSGAAAAAAAVARDRRIGWRDNGDGSIMMTYTAAGDTNLDSMVDILDATNLVTSGRYDTGTGTAWAAGDFNYDDVFDVLDISDFFNAGQYNAGMVSQAPASAATAGGLSDGDLAFAALVADTTSSTTPRKRAFAMI